MVELEGAGTPADQADSRANRSRTRLALAAMDAFAAKGYHATTTRDIAARAGMSPAAVYVHHRSKEELLFQLTLAGHENVLRLVREATAEATGPAERLAEVVRRFSAYHAREHRAARIVNYELDALSPEHQRVIRRLRRAIDGEVRRLVAAGVDAGTFHTSDVRMTTLALLSLGVDIARWYRTEGSWTPDDVADHYAELALRMVGANGDGRARDYGA